MKFDGDIKRIIRDGYARNLEVVSKCIVGFWGEEGKDLFQLKENGSIDPKKTYCIGIENGGDKNKPKQVRTKIKNNARKTLYKAYRENQDNCYFHAGELHTLKLDVLPDGLKVDRFIDDMCGNMTLPIMKTLNKNSHHFADKFHIPITIKMVNRHNDLVDIIDSNMNGVGKKIKNDLNEVTWTSIGYQNCDREKVENHVIPQLVALQLAFSEWNMIIEKCYHYKNCDKNSMSVEMIHVDVFMVKSKNKNDVKVRCNRYNTVLKEAGLVDKETPKKRGRPRKNFDTIRSNAYGIAEYYGFIDKNRIPLLGEWDKIKGQKIAHLTIMGNKMGIKNVKDKIENIYCKHGL